MFFILLTFVGLKTEMLLKNYYLIRKLLLSNATILFCCREPINCSNSLAKLAGALNAALSCHKLREASPYALIWS